MVSAWEHEIPEGYEKRIFLNSEGKNFVAEITTSKNHQSLNHG
jgi:hypothetical protein